MEFYSFDIINPLPKVFNETEAFQEILAFEKNITLSNKIFYDFRYINSRNKLIEENIKFVRAKKPDVSVVMLIYNQAYCLHKCIRSIQNQSLKNIEIIVVDDCSLDKSVELIKQYQKEDPRIILIEHDTNFGAMKTRVDGIKKAKGKYITAIDGDDAFIHKDVLKNSFYVAQKGNIDIIELQKYIYYGGKFRQKPYSFPNVNLNYIVHQPELRTKFVFINKKYHFYLRNRQACGKIIKNELYKKAFEYIGEEYTEDYMNYAEDTIFTLSFFHLANSYYLLKEMGYLYYFGQKVKNFTKAKNKVCKVVNKIKGFDFFKYVKFLIEKTGNNSKEQILAYKELTLLNFDYHLNNTKLEERHYNIIFKIFEKALAFEFLNKGQKNHLINLRNKVIDKKNKDNFG